MKIATWNINGIKARLTAVKKWLEQTGPDIVCFQEIKSQTSAFPSELFEDFGYNVVVNGQKSFNGVAILSKLPIDDITDTLPGDDTDEQARYLEISVTEGKTSLRVSSIYLPNGNPVESDKFPYKLAWMKRLENHVLTLLDYEEPLVLAGDYNIIPSDIDVYDPDAWRDDALFRPESLSHFRTICNLGLTDAYRACHSNGNQYTFWDYQRGAWQKDHGLRIDHLLLSPQAADRLKTCHIDRFTRGWEKPSDHTPVWVDLAIDS